MKILFFEDILVGVNLVFTLGKDEFKILNEKFPEYCFDLISRNQWKLEHA